MTRLNFFWLLIGSLIGLAVAPNLLASEAPKRILDVDESETQLAKRLAARDTGDSPFEYSLGVGLRKDSLSWSIADVGVNIASEVQWNSLTVTQLQGRAKLNLQNDWQVRAAVAAGAVRSGDNQDSDYAGSNRTQEFSRSNNKSGGSVSDFSIAVGKKLRRADFTNGDTFHLISLVGLAIQQQNLTMFNGVQTIPANGAFPGLGNSYDAKWQGAWLGFEAMRGMGDKLTLNAKSDFHLAAYSAEANWNLRQDLEHPVSFKHRATGLGLVIGVGGTYRFNKNFQMDAALDYQTWTTRRGHDQTYFANSTTSSFSLNPVRWNSGAFNFGAAYLF